MSCLTACHDADCLLEREHQCHDDGCDARATTQCDEPHCKNTAGIRVCTGHWPDEARIRADERERVLAAVFFELKSTLPVGSVQATLKEVIDRVRVWRKAEVPLEIDRARGGGKPERIPGATEVEPGVYVANESLSLWPKMKP